MSDLRDPKLMYLKAALFVVIGFAASTMIVINTRSWIIALLLALTVWAFARAYYFAFYVIEHYIDEGYRFSGLVSFIRYLARRKKDRDSGDES